MHDVKRLLERHDAAFQPARRQAAMDLLGLIIHPIAARWILVRPRAFAAMKRETRRPVERRMNADPAFRPHDRRLIRGMGAQRCHQNGEFSTGVAQHDSVMDVDGGGTEVHQAGQALWSAKDHGCQRDRVDPKVEQGTAAEIRVEKISLALAFPGQAAGDT